MNWTADSVHVVLFPYGAVGLDGLSIWHSLFGSSPSTLQSNPPGMPQSSVCQGVVGSYQAILVTALGRLELALGPSNQTALQFPTLQDPLSALRSLLPYANQLILGNDASRASLVTKLTKQFEQRDEVFQAFVDFTGISIFPSTAQELVVSGNVPSVFSDKITTMNRIAKCQMQNRTAGLVVLGPRGNIVPQTVEGEFLYFEVDMSTPISDQKVDRQKLSNMFDELLKETEAILSNGYGYVLHPNN